MAEVLERGELFFFYRPRVDTHRVRGFDDIARFYIVLRPRDREVYRRIIVGAKRLPEIEEHGRHWALVERVEHDPGSILEELGSEIYETVSRREREVPGARPAGEAVYAIVDHEGHRHLAYRLELPRRRGEVQRALRIEREASYVVTVRNPYAPSQLGSRRRGPRYPNRLQARFRRRRFAPVDPAHLDYLLIAA
jgi:hypothetical protein